MWCVCVLKERFVWIDIKKSYYISNFKLEDFIYFIFIYMLYGNFFDIYLEVV